MSFPPLLSYSILFFSLSLSLRLASQRARSSLFLFHFIQTRMSSYLRRRFATCFKATRGRTRDYEIARLIVSLRTRSLVSRASTLTHNRAERMLRNDSPCCARNLSPARPSAKSRAFNNRRVSVAREFHASVTVIEFSSTSFFLPSNRIIEFPTKLKHLETVGKTWSRENKNRETE